QFDANGKMTTKSRVPRPHYTHRCFVLTRAARQFLYHAKFIGGPPMNDETYRLALEYILSRDPRKPSETPMILSGFDNLRDFSKAQEKMVKAQCGGAWRSYVLRSHWR